MMLPWSLLLLAAAVAVETARWPYERTSGRFLCHADFALQEVQPLLAELGDLQRDVQTTWELRGTGEPVHLFLFHDRATYQQYLQRHFPSAPDRRALFIKGRGPGMVFAFRGDDFETDVRHECAHALLQSAAPGLPLWLDEGLAEYLEVPRGDRQRKNPHHEYVTAFARLGRIPRLEELEELAELNDFGRSEYRDAWAWTHFCLHGPAAAGDELKKYLHDHATGLEPGKFSTRLRRRVPQLETAVLRHFLSASE
jgi:hypothetical protein